MEQCGMLYSDNVVFITLSAVFSYRLLREQIVSLNVASCFTSSHQPHLKFALLTTEQL